MATPWWQKAGHCCESCAYGYPCEHGCPANNSSAQGDTGGNDEVNRQTRKRKSGRRAIGALQQGSGPPRSGVGFGWSGGYQSHHRRWPVQRRTAPYPIPQRPYPIGLDIAQIIEPFQGCPTRAAYYYWEPTCE
jgi:hypothetical protein